MPPSESHSDDLTTLTQLSAQLLDEYRLPQAAAVARQVAELAPNEPAPWYVLGTALLGLGEADEAERCLEKALECDGDRLEYHRSMAQVCLQRGDMKGAAENCERGIEIERNSLHLHHTLGRAKAFGGDLAGACECLERCVELDPENSLVRAELGDLYLRRCLYEPAIQHLRTALGKEPQRAFLWRGLGHALSRQGSSREAVEAFQNAVAIEPKDSSNLYNLGDAYLALGEPTKAIAALMGAVTLTPDYALAQYDLGLAFFQMGRFEEGANASRAALQQDPDMKLQRSNLGIGATGNLGLCLTNLGRPEEAIACYERSLRLFAPTFFNLGLAQFKLRRFEEALTNFEMATKIEPNNAEYLDLLGNAHSELNQLPEATVALEQAIAAQPTYALAHYDLGTVLAKGRKKSHMARAMASFRAALELEPSLYWADYAMACLHALAGKTAKALQSLEQAVRKGLTDFDRIQNDPDLVSLRGDSTYEELLRLKRPRFQYSSPMLSGTVLPSSAQWVALSPLVWRIPNDRSSETRREDADKGDAADLKNGGKDSPT